jgi:AraC-like DNA-binding protein
MNFMVTERGLFSARSTLFELAHVDAQRCRETLRRVKHAGVPHHRIIVDGFRAVLEAQADLPFAIPAISQMIGVSSRTLRLACQEQLGVSPVQYVMLCRTRSARLALQQADPDVARVTDIATELGFWELGRFAVKYRRIFGETPSVTLRRGA